MKSVRLILDTYKAWNQKQFIFSSRPVSLKLTPKLTQVVSTQVSSLLLCPLFLLLPMLSKHKIKDPSTMCMLQYKADCTVSMWYCLTSYNLFVNSYGQCYSVVVLFVEWDAFTGLCIKLRVIYVYIHILPVALRNN